MATLSSGITYDRALWPSGSTKTLTDLSFDLPQTVCYRGSGIMLFRLSYGGVITVVSSVTLVASNREFRRLEMVVTRRKQTTELISNRKKLDPLRECISTGSHHDFRPMEAL
jgi:hypothetical protein